MSIMASSADQSKGLILLDGDDGSVYYLLKTDCTIRIF